MKGVIGVSRDDLMMEVKEDIAHIKAILSTMADTNTMAFEALQSTRSAHKRLDKLEKTVNWGMTTVVGTVIIGVVTYFMGGR